MTPMDQAERQRLEKGLQALGVTPEDFNTVQRQPTYELACAKLEEVKEKVRKAYKRLAFELHPDRTGNDIEKTELFKAVGQVKADIESLNINPPRPPPMMAPMSVMIPVVVVQYHGVGRPPTGHPAANGGVRQWGQGTGSATTVTTSWPVGVYVQRGPRR
jgi:hypothetical protein